MIGVARGWKNAIKFLIWTLLKMKTWVTRWFLNVVMRKYTLENDEVIIKY